MTRLKQTGDAVIIGTMIRTVRNPTVALIAKGAGLNFLMVDMEHDSYPLEVMADLAVAARGVGLRLFVRVPELARGHVSRVLDSGAQGVMVPMVETRAQAQDLVKWAKYPPIGSRGFFTFGIHTNFLKISDAQATMDKVNNEVLTIAQIETKKGVEAVEAIASVEGLDALLIGPNDLAISLGHAGDLQCKEEENAIEQVAVAAKKNGKIFGIHADASLIQRWAPYGLSLIMQSTDGNILASGMKAIRENAMQAYQASST